MRLIIVALLFLACGFFGLNDYLYQGYLGLFFVGTLIAVVIKRKVHPLPALLFFYLTVLALIYIIEPLYFTRGLDITVIMGLQVLTMQSYLYVVMIVLPFLFFDMRYMDVFILCFSALGLADSYVMMAKILAGKLPYFLMNNPAIDSSFIACTIPMLMLLAGAKNKQKLLRYALMVFVPVLVCFFTKTSSGILGVGVGVASYLWCKGGLKKAHLGIAFVFCSLVSAVGYVMQKATLFDGSGRYMIWKHSLEFWLNQGHNNQPPYIPHFIGAGLGSFFMYGPSLQIQDAVNAKFNGLDVFFWLHNDWAQVLFETGYIGLALTILVFVMAVYKARNMPVIFSSLLTFGAVAFIQMPLRFFTFAFLGLFLVSRAFCPSKEGSAQTTNN